MKVSKRFKEVQTKVKEEAYSITNAINLIKEVANV